MARNNRRFAGAKLVAVPFENVTPQLRVAKQHLEALAEGAKEKDIADQQFAQSLEDSFIPKGSTHRVALHANARPMGGMRLGDLDKGPFMGDPETYRLLAEVTPKTEYNMSWDVDGSYNGGRDIDPRERVRIARETQRRWDGLISKMEEGALVTNSPVGAGQGDYGRADLYMASGFGPVQGDGQQYGVIRSGKIVPISPYGVDEDHGKHLAKRARMAGDVEFSDKMLKALDSNTKLRRDYGPNRQAMAQDAKDGYDSYGGYDDSDYGYDDDYEPPFRSEREFKEAFGQGRPVSDPVEMRRQAEDLRAYPGVELDRDQLDIEGRSEFSPEGVAAWICH